MPENLDHGLRWRMLILRAAGLDPDGRCQPMRPAGEWCEDADALCAEHYRKVERDKALRRAIQRLGDYRG